MTALHVRNVPDSVMASIRERADRHGRSVQQEVREILAAAAAEPAEGIEPEPIRLFTVRTAGAGTWSREEIYGDEGR